MIKGSRGDHVQLLQGALVDLGHKMPISLRPKGKPDGTYGSETVAAVVAFQKKNSITSDGIAGKETLANLIQLWFRSRLCSPRSS